jgi:anti-sigma factor RsiW
MTIPDPNQPSDADLRDVAALADGSLPDRRRAEVEARIAAAPALRAELERHRRALSAIRAASGEVRAPATLRDRIESGAAAGGARPATGATRRRWWTGWPAVVVAGAAAAVIAIGVVALPGSEPTVIDAAELAELAPSEPAPPRQPEEPTLLAASFEGLSYPDWAKEFGWHAVGERSDELDGRATHTVFYENADGARIAYTIVSGDALDPPEGGERSVVDGVELDAFAADGTPAVTWLRDGHTCVLAGDAVEQETLLELAAWKGDGAVAF